MDQDILATKIKKSSIVKQLRKIPANNTILNMAETFVIIILPLAHTVNSVVTGGCCEQLRGGDQPGGAAAGGERVHLLHHPARARELQPPRPGRYTRRYCDIFIILTVGWGQILDTQLYPCSFVHATHIILLIVFSWVRTATATATAGTTAPPSPTTQSTSGPSSSSMTSTSRR